jgi:pimeloyl-ACP methyl ester carboxylesterase
MEPIPLVLLPGLDGSGRLFRPFLLQLPEWIEPVVVPYPSDRAMSYGDLVEHVRPRLPVDRPFALLGESFGGPLAIRLATEKPQQLCGLILCGTFARNPHLWIPQVSRHLVHPVLFRLWPMIWLARRVLGLGISSEIQHEICEAQRAVSGAALAMRLKEVIRVDVREELRRVDVPVLSLTGLRDWIVPGWNGRAISKLCSSRQGACGFEETGFEAGHLILQGHAAQASSVVTDFVRRMAAVGPPEQVDVLDEVEGERI